MAKPITKADVNNHVARLSATLDGKPDKCHVLELLAEAFTLVLLCSEITDQDRVFMLNHLSVAANGYAALIAEENRDV